VPVEQGQRLVQLPGLARGKDVHEVLAPALPRRTRTEPREEEVSVRVVYFLSPRFPRSRRSFDDALFFFARRFSRFLRRAPDASTLFFDAFDAFDTGSE
jgi:hypothetical protein